MKSAKRVLSELGMIPKNARVLVAVSGGIDSMVLLDVLAKLSDEQAFDLVIGTIDHGLRGRASMRDAAFVETKAAEYGLPFVESKLAPAEIEKYKAHGREGAARNARLNALEALAKEVGATRIAVGHSLDDHAETILYHLARGAGPTGLRGIAPIRLPFIRPLIRTSRKEIRTYAMEHSLIWREDASNSDSSLARNHIRHHILPGLQAINPRITESLSRNANLLADLDVAATFLLDEQMCQLIIPTDEETFSLNRDRLMKLPRPVLQLALREGLRRVRGNLNGITLAHIDALRALVIGSRSHGELSLPQLHIRMQANVLTLMLESPETTRHWRMDVGLGTTQLPGKNQSLTLEIVPIRDFDLESIRSDPWTEAADADCLSLALHLRTRQQGDRFAPLGLGHEIKLKDFLMNDQTAFFDRNDLPLLCDSCRIVWVAGIRLSDAVKLSERTQRVLVMRMEGVR